MNLITTLTAYPSWVTRCTSKIHQHFQVSRRVLLTATLLVNSPSYAVDKYFTHYEDDPSFTVDLTQYFVLPATFNFYAINYNSSLLSVSQSGSNCVLFICDNNGKIVTVTLQPNQNGTAIIETAGDLTLPVGGSLSDTKLYLHITVNPVNDAPVANNIVPLTTNEDTSVSSILPATDIDSPVLFYSVVTNGTKGTAIFPNPNSGEFIYTPYPDVNGTDSFTVKANDGFLDSNVVTVNVIINPVNDAPTFTATSPPIRYNIWGGAMVFKNWATFKPGPANEANQTLVAYTVSKISNPSLFVVPPAIDKEGTLTYTLAAGKWESSTFEVTVQDNGGTAYGGIDLSAPQTFIIAVTPRPLSNNLSLFLQLDGTGKGKVTSNTGLSCQSSDCQEAADGTLTCNPQTCFQAVPPATTITFTPQADEGSYFSSWGGHPDCIKQQFLMDRNKWCVAYFDLLDEPLTIAIAGQGSVTATSLNCPAGTCTTNYPYGTSVTLQTQPAAGWQFQAWSGDCSSTGQVLMISTKTCSATFILNPTTFDEDLDHVPNAIEDAAPNHGDGNGDGIPDSQQNNVNSFVDLVSGKYLTLQVDKGCPITNVYSELPDKYPGVDPNHHFPQGLTYFEISCAKTQVTVYYHGINRLYSNMKFYKYGPTVPGDMKTVGWYQYPATYAVVTIGGRPVLTATYTLIDGQLGDSTGVDGKIVDPGGIELE